MYRIVKSLTFLACSTLFFVCISFSLSAQIIDSSPFRDNVKPIESPEKQSVDLDDLVKKLELKDLQGKNFKSTVLRYRSRMMGVHNKDGLKRKTKRSLLNDIQLESDKEIAMILNEEQFKIYKTEQVNIHQERLPPPGKEPKPSAQNKIIQLKNDN